MMLVRGVHFNWSTLLGNALQSGQIMSNYVVITYQTYVHE